MYTTARRITVVFSSRLLSGVFTQTGNKLVYRATFVKIRILKRFENKFKVNYVSYIFIFFFKFSDKVGVKLYEQYR